MARKIAIIGCGIGGLACALYLSKTSDDVTLIDKFERPEPVGSGLVIQPVGQDVLAELGCAQSLIERGAKIYSMFGTESDLGKSVLNVDYGPENEAVFGLAIHRASLFDILFQAMEHTKTHLIKGQNIKSTALEGGQRFVTSQSGTKFGPFDLVIDASGARSHLSNIKTKALSFGALWGTVNWIDSSPLPTNHLSQCYQKAHKMLGVLPVGYLPGDPHPKATIFWSEPQVDLPKWPQNGLDSWKKDAIALWPDYGPFIDQIKTADQMTPTTYRHGTLFQPYDKSLAIIGDAAHQASPQLGQGANMALLDARALCQALSEHDINAALKVYARKCFAHIRLYQIFSAVFTPFYQSDSRSLPFLRNHIMNPLSRIWPLKPLLTRLVCGNLIKPK